MQIQPKIPAFDDFSYLLAQADSLANPAEIHGILCGLVCNGQKLDGKFWLHTALKLIESRAHIAARHRGAVIELYDSACKQLSGVDGELQLLLPPDERPLAERAAALSQWCQGFLYGFRLAQPNIEESLKEEVRDALCCIQEIAKLDFAQVEVREMDSEAYRGVIAFVTTAVMGIYNELPLLLQGDAGKPQKKAIYLH